ncbi:MAG: ABC transporter substrate-binding protein [Solirubrobacterales bacterium]
MNPLNRSSRLSTALLLGLALLAIAAIAGCGEKDENPPAADLKKDRIVLLLDWNPNADHAGIYTGMEQGTFDKQGIDVDVEVPSDPAAVIKQVAAGRADLGISYQNEVMEARDAGVKIKAIAAIVTTPLNSIMWLKKSKIKSIKDLKGKTVATSGAYGSTFLTVILKKVGLKPTDVKTVDVGYDLLPALVGGKADAIIGAYYNVEGVTLKQKNRPATIIPVDKAGAPKYDELVVIASEENLKDGGRTERYRRFLAGLANGTTLAIEDPKAAGDALVKSAKDLGGKNREFLDLSLKETLPVLKPAEGSAFGYMDPGVWATFGAFMRDQGILKNPPNTEDAYSNDFLPGQGPKDQLEAEN